MKKIIVIEPNEEIEDLQKRTQSELSNLLPRSHVEMVGAMAVPMAGKQELDVMVISKDIEEDSDILVRHGYKTGHIEDGIHFFKRMHGDMEIAVQILAPDHKIINTHRENIRRVRENPDLKKRFEEYKRTLSGLSENEYRKAKNEWRKKYVFPEKS